MDKKIVKNNLLRLIAIIILTSLDQISKIVAVNNLKGKDAFVIIKGIFEFNYLENRGAAFGFLQNQKFFFIIITIILVIFFTYAINKFPVTKHFFPLQLAYVLLVSGAIGNFIDRISNSYVVDFIYFKLINFPIFNIADCYVTISVVILIISIIFIYDEKELSWKK